MAWVGTPGVLWLPEPEHLAWAPQPCPVVIKPLHYGEPVLAYDFQTMTIKELMQLEWRGTHDRIGIEYQLYSYRPAGAEEWARLGALADEELTRRGEGERYT
jgi:hypothetical protein